LDDTKSNRPTTGIDLCQKAYTQNKTKQRVLSGARKSKTAWKTQPNKSGNSASQRKLPNTSRSSLCS